MTPTELAQHLYGQKHGYSRSSGARKVRKIARRLYPKQAPGKGGEWNLTPRMVIKISHEVYKI